MYKLTNIPVQICVGRKKVRNISPGRIHYLYRRPEFVPICRYWIPHYRRNYKFRIIVGEIGMDTKYRYVVKR